MYLYVMCYVFIFMYQQLIQIFYCIFFFSLLLWCGIGLTFGLHIIANGGGQTTHLFSLFVTNAIFFHWVRDNSHFVGCGLGYRFCWHHILMDSFCWHHILMDASLEDNLKKKLLPPILLVQKLVQGTIIGTVFKFT